MKIHLVHSNDFDFRKELYRPLRLSSLSTEHNIFLPHETDKFTNTEQLIRNADIVVAEVSYPSTGMGIELGWANAFGVTIFCFYKNGSTYSKSLRKVSDTFIEYEDGEDLVKKLKSIIDKKV